MRPILSKLAATLLITLVPLRAFSADEKGPELRSGDIILQTSSSKQSYAITWASKSVFSHVGLIEQRGGQLYVLEAVATVRRTPLQTWIQRGRLGRYTVMRKEGLGPETISAILAEARRYLGRSYDPFFTLTNRQIYCSELVWLAYRGAGLDVGRKQKLRELDMDNVLVRALFEKRRTRHPLCQRGKERKNKDACWQKVLDDDVITPASLGDDPGLKRIFDNYPL